MYTYKTVERNLTVETLVYAFDKVRPEHFYFSGESHDFWEILFVDSGNVTTTAEARIYRLNTGKALFHKPMEFHRLWTDDKPAHLKSISFTASGGLMERFKETCLSLNAEECELFSEITSLFISTHRAYKKGDIKEYTLLSNKTAVLLEYFLISLIDKPNYSHKDYSHSERQYYRIVNIMKEHCETSLSVDQIAELSNMSTSNMKRVFSLYSDIGVAKYFLNLKINRARELLKDGLSPSDTASRLEFNEISYFYTVFKRETGMTPSQFIKNNSKE